MKKLTLIRGTDELPRLLMARVERHGLRQTARDVAIAHNTLAGYHDHPENMPLETAAKLAMLFGARICLAVDFPNTWTADQDKALVKIDEKIFKAIAKAQVSRKPAKQVA